MNGESSLSPQIRLGLQCRDLKRYADAEKHFKEALSANPLDDVALHLLATTLHAQDGREREALEVIDRAISADPNDSGHHAFRACVLTSLERPREALTAAATARELDPYSDFALTAEAQAHLGLRNWQEAERAAREALAIDADQSAAANILATALRMQGRQVENDAQIAGLLERDAEDPYTHLNAGWSALQRGAHRDAERHFREALRIDPEFDAAREGLLTSFRARSPFYRAYLAYCMRLARLKEGAQWAVIIGIYVIYRVLRGLASTVSPGLAIGIGALYLVFVLWGFVANAVGNFMLLFDRFARYALRRNETVEAALVGGGVVAGLGLLILGFAAGLTWPLIGGGALVVAAIPGAMVFTNRSKAGSWLFGAVAVAVLGSATFFIAARATGDQDLGSLALRMLVISGFCAMISTWLSGVKPLRR